MPVYVKQITKRKIIYADQPEGPGGAEIVALMWNRTVEWDDGDWRQLASCRSTEPDLFFPIGTTGPAVDQIEAAKRVCRSCEVQEPCLDFALATNQESGVWGGTSEEERRKLRRAWLAARRRAG